ncbi:uncharacterized protein BCR38DRAFT_485036 [Pseudomassariella vexata]|uniref:BTB domain-containing protein n=1 Tax=Pseudomassariella vexata TaxID=1141098 RepID=A0A1Y2DXN4_9PEZI|nr:uncharacterized protein BCR38DRAFT_485036 [Pseudomassariella vexata]ORY63886.1 hypothetical protein BCR38DRAFT_485036 [Pseudomassariella vexata]
MAAIHSPGLLTPIKEDETSVHGGTIDADGDVVIIFHADWDITIKVGKYKYKVSAANVATASAEWRRRLYGKDAPSRPVDGDDWEVLAEKEDDSKALGTLLSIAHFSFNKVSNAPSLDELYAITILTNKYACTHLVYPWSGKWVEGLSTLVADEDCAIKAHKAAWIAYELGDCQLLKDMSDSLVVNAKVDGNGEIVNEAGMSMKDFRLPNGLLERITTVRAETVAKLLKQIKVPLDHLTGIKRLDPPKFCRTGIDVDSCESIMLGSALKALVPAGLYPVPDPDKFTGSIKDLKNAVCHIKFFDFRGEGYAPHKGHKGCNLGFQEVVKQVTKAMPVAIDQMQLEHVILQARISGLDKSDAADGTLYTDADDTEVKTEATKSEGSISEGSNSDKPARSENKPVKDEDVEFSVKKEKTEDDA